MDKNELDEIQEDLMAILDLPQTSLEKFVSCLENETELNSFNILDLVGISGSKSECMLKILQNKKLDQKTILIALRAALAARKKATSVIEDFELCWTGPTSLDVRERTTEAVMQEMIERAREKIIIVDYRITDKGDTLKMLSDRMGMIKELIIIIDDDKKNINMSTLDKAFLGIKKPKIFLHKQPEKPYYKVHAKILIVDEEILITSANLTYYGLNENFEMGIRIKGEPARGAEELLRKMIDTKYFEQQ